MQLQLLFLAALPVIVYFVARNHMRERNAIGLAIGASGVEALYNSIQLGFVEPFSATSFVAFLALGLLSIRTEKLVYFEFQPVLLEVVLAVALFYYRFVLDDRLFARIIDEYVHLNDIVPPYQHGYVDVYAHSLSTSLPFALLLHAGLLGAIALHRSVRWWFWFRVAGLYLLLAALFFAERLFQASY